MKEKIKLEEIAGYLAHKLHAVMLDYKKDYVGKEIDIITGFEQWDKSGELWCCLTLGGSKPSFDRIKPILFPIESIFNEVDFYGEKVSVWEKILDLVRDRPSSLRDISQTILSCKNMINSIDADLLPLAFIKLFQKYHVDYQGLISQGKAINALEL